MLPYALRPPAVRLAIRVYRGDRLVASFVGGRRPVYRGAAGRRLRLLLEAGGLCVNPWTGEARPAGVYADSPEWLVASVLLGSGLARAGYRAASYGEPAGRPYRWPG